MSEMVTRAVSVAQMQIVNDVIGSWKSQVLFTLLKVGVFDLLEKSPADIASMAKELDIPQDSLRRLVESGVSIGYLSKEANLYNNSEIASNVLVYSKPGFMGNWLRLCSRWYDSFGKLEKAVRTNGAVENINFDDDPVYKELFIDGMIDYAQYRGSDVLNYLDLTNKKRVLDVGCGPAVYSAMFCEKYPDLQVTCLDLPHALQNAKKYLANKDLNGRIELVNCDYVKEDSFGSGYDVAFLSHVLHQEDEDRCLNLLAKSFRALRPGGLLVVQAMFIDAKGMSSTYASLHDLLALLIFPGGKNHTIEDTIGWLKKVGFINVRHQSMSLFNINSLVLGEKA